jgi:hypothetical protein
MSDDFFDFLPTRAEAEMSEEAATIRTIALRLIANGVDDAEELEQRVNEEFKANATTHQEDRMKTKLKDYGRIPAAVVATGHSITIYHRGEEIETFKSGPDVQRLVIDCMTKWGLQPDTRSIARFPWLIRVFAR